MGQSVEAGFIRALTSVLLSPPPNTIVRLLRSPQPLAQSSAGAPQLAAPTWQELL